MKPKDSAYDVIYDDVFESVRIQIHEYCGKPRYAQIFNRVSTGIRDKIAKNITDQMYHGPLSHINNRVWEYMAVNFRKYIKG